MQKTQVQFTAPNGSSQLSVTLVPDNLMPPLFVSVDICMCMVHMHTVMSIYMHKIIKINHFLKATVMRLKTSMAARGEKLVLGVAAGN